jgi:undecaprenyl-diphosphatase
MLKLLLDLDTALFRFFNITLANPVCDRVMPFVTNGEHWLLAIVFAVVILVHAQRMRSVPMLVGVAIVFATCDQVSAHLLKPLFERVRPCHVVDGVHLLVGCSDSASFPSAHAANSFGCAVFLAWALPRWRWTYFALSALVSLSRVCVGAHYPGDLLGGFCVGALAATVVIFCFEKLDLRSVDGLPALPIG